METMMNNNSERPEALEPKTVVSTKEVIILVLTCLITGFLMKLPQLIGGQLNDFPFYEKNAGLILFLGLSAYWLFTNKQVKRKQLLFTLIAFVVTAVYINLLPSVKGSHSIMLAYIHLPLLLWCLYGVVYIDFDTKNTLRRMDYLKYNGDMAVLTAIILIAGALLTGLSIGLFSAIGMNIERFYTDYVVIVGLVSAPIVATYVVKNHPSVTHKIAPIIAGIFTPLVLLTLVVFLISIAVTGKDPYNDRDFLLVFNVMLLGVMALIVFSVSETTVKKGKRFTIFILVALSLVALLVDVVALSAIVYRLGEYGFTPNRTAVLGSNLLIFGNLLLIMIELFKVAFKGLAFEGVERIITRYLPIYTAWTLFVTFFFPLIFGMK